MLKRIIKYFLENPLITILLLLVFIIWGIVTAPFNWNINFLPRDPVPVDAIPDIVITSKLLQLNGWGAHPVILRTRLPIHLPRLYLEYLG